MFYELATSSWGKNELLAMDEVIKSGNFTMGSQVSAFEREFATYFCMNFGAMVYSGSSANLVSISALFFCVIGSALMSFFLKPQCNDLYIF